MDTVWFVKKLYSRVATTLRYFETHNTRPNADYWQFRTASITDLLLHSAPDVHHCMWGISTL